MAYSDYGGYSYRNGQRVEERSDALLSADGVKSTPGMWPGWILPEGRNGGSWHALLGDGPIFVGLYKQSGAVVFSGLDRIHEFDGDAYRESEKSFVAPDGSRVDVVWEQDDNFYVYARLTQPDGTVWTGFSGYGVGAGLEDCGYGFSTKDRERRLFAIFPVEQRAQSAEAQGGERQ